MCVVRKGFWAVAFVTALAALPTATAVADNLSSNFFSDSYVRPTGSQAQSLLQGDRAKCPRAGHGSVSIPTLSAALAAAQGKLRRLGNSAAVRRVSRASDVRDPRRARALAAAGVAAGRPGLALAALLASLHRHPRDPRTLVDLGSVLTMVGMPRQGLAVLQSVHGFGRSVPVLGIPLKAVAVNDRGWAWFQLGDFAKAQKQFAQAAGIAPLFLEARQNATASKFCATPLGVWRAGSPEPFRDAVFPPVSVSPPDGGQVVPAADALDLSQGQPQQEIQIPTFADARTTASYQGNYQALVNDELGGDIQQSLSQLQPAHDKWLATHPSPASKRRVAGIWIQLGLDGTQSDVKALDDQVNAAGRQVDDDAAAFQSGFTPPVCDNQPQCCYDAEQSWHAGWLRDYQLLASDEAKYFNAYSQYYTAVAANLSDPSLYQEAMLGLRQWADTRASNLGMKAMQWSAYLSVCGDAGPGAGDENPTISTPGASHCTRAMKDFGVSMGLGELTNGLFPVALSVGCEKVSLAAKTAGPVAGFVQATFGIKGGSATIFAGGSAELKAGPLGIGGKTGLYMKLDRDGIEDVGWRFSPSLSASAPGGIATFKGSDDMDFSFAGAFDFSTPE